MELSKKLAKFLKKHKVLYEVQAHPRTVTAAETAQSEHVPGSKMVKAVMVNVDGKDAMVALPSNRKLNLDKLGAALGKLNVRIEEEAEFKGLFPDCEAGAMPPFGKMYGIPCYADHSLGEEEELYFNAGNHLETIKLAAADFFRVSKAVVGDFSEEKLR